jgi:DNA polymerase II large subunit
MTAVPVDTIEPPVVRLKSGEVIRVESMEHAADLQNEIAEILFVGDLLVSFGDYQKSNHPIVPSPWVEEWWALELKAAGANPPQDVTFETAYGLSQAYGVPLHPDYNLFWHDVSVTEIQALAKFVLEKGIFDGRRLQLPTDPAIKGILVSLGALHLEAEVVHPAGEMLRVGHHLPCVLHAELHHLVGRHRQGHERLEVVVGG